ncbi:hypothetical protein GKQ38_05505 [Candidatus Nanohaloarchaea archaeon]|nr:hypothetical protein GKQ38_05505 [Candidatus Nanohaloarchaea archaeon]
MRWISAFIIFVLANVVSASFMLGGGARSGPALPHRDSRYDPLEVPMQSFTSYSFSNEANMTKIQPPKKQVFKDQEVELIYDIGFNGTSYALYLINNSWDRADRTKVVSSQGIVTGKEAEQALAFMAWRYSVNATFNSTERQVLKQNGHELVFIRSEKAASKAINILAYREALRSSYSPKVEQNLESILQTANETKTHVVKIESTTSAILNIVERMKETEISYSGFSTGRTVWDAATLASPSLDIVVDSIRGLDSELEEWKSVTSSLLKNGKSLAERFQEYGETGETDYHKLTEDLQATQKSLDKFQEKTKQLDKTLGDIASGVENIEKEVSSLPVLGDAVSNLFNELDQRILAARLRIDELQVELVKQEDFLGNISESHRQAFQKEAEQLESNAEIYSKWKQNMISDQEASSRVRKMIAWIALITISTLAMIYKTGKSILHLFRKVKTYLNPEKKENELGHEIGSKEN